MSSDFGISQLMGNAKKKASGIVKDDIMSSLRGLVAGEGSPPPKPERFTAPLFTVPGISPKGILALGNIDIAHRPSVLNPETGGRSSVWSMSFGTDQGEVLIPRISDDGRILTEEQAIEQYRKTGRHLGIFSSIEDANAYAEALHRQQEAMGKGLSSVPIPRSMRR